MRNDGSRKQMKMVRSVQNLDVLKIKSTQFDEGLNMGHGRKSIVNDTSKFFDLNIAGG